MDRVRRARHNCYFTPSSSILLYALRERENRGDEAEACEPKKMQQQNANNEIDASAEILSLDMRGCTKER